MGPEENNVVVVCPPNILVPPQIAHLPWALEAELFPRHRDGSALVALVEESDGDRSVGERPRPYFAIAGLRHAFPLASKSILIDRDDLAIGEERDRLSGQDGQIAAENERRRKHRPKVQLHPIFIDRHADIAGLK